MMDAAMGDRPSREDGPSRSEGLGLRERKKAEARAAIVRAALTLYRQRGFDNVTIDQIAENAGVARRTYFRYFPTKEAVVLDRRAAQLNQFRQLVEAAPVSIRAVDLLRSCFTTIAEDYRTNRHRILIERELFANSPNLAVRDIAMDREFEQVIVDAILQRSQKSPGAMRSARLLAAAAMGILRVVIDEWAAADGAPSLAKLGEPALDIIAALAPAHDPA